MKWLMETINFITKASNLIFLRALKHCSIVESLSNSTRNLQPPTSWNLQRRQFVSYPMGIVYHMESRNSQSYFCSIRLNTSREHDHLIKAISCRAIFLSRDDAYIWSRWLKKILQCVNYIQILIVMPRYKRHAISL